MNRIIFLLIAALFLQSCGTVMYGSRQEIPISIQPSGSLVTVRNSPALSNPSSLSLDRKHDQIIIITREGYEPETVSFSRRLNTAASIVGNILIPVPLAFLVGLITDLSTGGAWTLSPESVSVSLTSKTASAAPSLKATAAQPAGSEYEKK